MTDEFLNAIFRFKHNPPIARQDNILCTALAHEFVAFVASLKAIEVEGHACGRVEPLADDRVVPSSAFAVHELEALKEVCRCLETTSRGQHHRGDVWIDPWLSKYGCAIQRTMLSAAEVKLELIFPDKWERKLHLLPTGECIHASVPKTHHVLHCANLATDLVDTYEAAFALELAQAQQRRGSERSAATHELGHQKTPQFIAAVIRRALESVTGTSPSYCVAPRGGTTDVGQHTGGKPRDTCWALVEAVIKQNLCCGFGLFRKTMMQYQLSLLRTKIHEIIDVFGEKCCVNVKDGCDAVDDVFFMLQVVVENVVELLEDGYQVSVLLSQCTTLRANIDNFVTVLNRQTAEQYVLPDNESLKQLQVFNCGVEIESPKRDNESNGDETKEERQRRALINLAAHSLLDGTSCSFRDLLEWGKSNTAPESYKGLLVIRTIETYLFSRSRGLNGDEADDESFSVEMMQDVVTLYQKVASNLQLTWSLTVEQRSRELLVMWVAFCLVHQQCVTQVPLCSQYKIALEWKDLKVSVVRNLDALTALQCVAKYIRGWNKQTRGPPLFHLTVQGPTFEFGWKFSTTDPTIQTVYKDEIEAWEAHVQVNWAEIERKKAMANSLRSRIASLTQNLLSVQKDLAEEKARLLQAYPHNYQKRYRRSPAEAYLRSQVSEYSSTIQRTKAQLRRALAMPDYLVRPLPIAERDAYQVLFLLLMPRNLEILGNLCLTAQRALAPEEMTPEMTDVPELSGTKWYEFHANYTPSSRRFPANKGLTASPSVYTLPQSYGPKSVDELSSVTQYVSECVWNPSLFGTAFTWKDAVGEVVDPFKAPACSILESFTEKISKPFEEFQWMNSWPGESDTRGNLVYAKLHQQRPELEKTAFLVLGSLRGFPNQQFRKLQCALVDDLFLWSNPCVETIVRQSLYQVGDLTDEKEPQILWKTDMFREQRGLKTFCVILKVMAEKLEQTPRNFEDIPLLSELAGYVHQFIPEANPLIKLFAGMAKRWAGQLKDEYEAESCPKRIAACRQHECILYGYALLAYKLGPWNDNAAQKVSELLVRFRTSFLCASINETATDMMLSVERRIIDMMCRRIADLVAHIGKRGDNNILTGLVRLVSTTCPTNLEWEPVSEMDDEHFGCCYEDTSAHYAINLFTGVVLTDGNAPGGLPRGIREHNRFLELFGQCNFEVVCEDGILRTQRPYCDRLYDFALQAADELFIQELTVNATGEVTRTLQLCSAQWIKTFSIMFPTRLRELYSQWYWIETECVVFRPKEAKHRNVFFIAVFNEAGALQCYQVPSCDCESPYEEILARRTTYDVLTPKESLLNVLQVLTKFEDEQFVHVLKTPEGVLKIELPRCKLTFWLNRNLQLESVEHKGYILSIHQQFDNFLPRFRRYLVLELQDKRDTNCFECRMLLPVGFVVESLEGYVDIDIPNDVDCLVHSACYEVHSRLKTFDTETISARLELAAVCIRAGTNVPSKRLQMTGAEAAVAMLRACRSRRPYSSFEVATLQSICKLSFREPAVKILAVTLLADADRLAFLFNQDKTLDVTMDAADEKSEYSDMCVAPIPRNPLRSQLGRIEENRIVGHVHRSQKWISSEKATNLTLISDENGYVNRIETRLKRFVHYESVNTSARFPLELKTQLNPMSRDMVQELRVSWDCYHSQAQMKLKDSTESLVSSFSILLEDVSCHRRKKEEELKVFFLQTKSSTRDQFLTLANYLPTLTVKDLVRCTFDEDTLHQMMPRLSVDWRRKFKKSILQFMELCVLEDKMERLVWKCSHRDKFSDSQIIDELATTREWNTMIHPYWLAFEVEGRLQIRHEQYVVAQHLIEQPGTVCQLNMGRGKTRVILPMLFLHFAHNGDPQIVRAHFLGPLLSEACEYMHRYLSASSTQICIFEQPFHRRISLDLRRLTLIHDALAELKQSGGIQVVAPEYRMSLELKRLELNDNDKVSTAIFDEILDKNQFIDVLDECDALLHHKYHLVYAVGDPVPLSSGVKRWQAAENLLRVLTSKTSESRVAKVLQAPHVCCVSPDYLSRLGAYDGTRLNAVVESTEFQREKLKQMLVLDLIENTSKLMWLNTLGRGAARNSLVMAITDSTVSLQEALGEHLHKFASYVDQLLALRGLVAFGVLEHCLEKRYRVDFGLPIRGTRPKKIAIPFRAADVPSERSEFSHPDVCIVLTLLGYYHCGLTDEEVRTTFWMLLRLDISEQCQEYEEWYKSVESGLNDEERKALCDVRHISLADTRQLQMLCKIYKFCMTAINFYLKTCVFPKDTQQYPQRLSRTAWNLAAGEKNIGFSGTNDNHRLLPLSVTQREPDEPSVSGTNGKMVDKILQVTQSYEVIVPCAQQSLVPWQSVLLFALDKAAQALIDTGALLAGVMNHDAAEYLLCQSNFEFDGVTYYDSRKEFNCWMITEKTRRLQVPLKKASMLEKETFVIFDEARSRGSDMKLRPDAAAVLTLGPKLTKDKLMQGAGRMRQLGCHQTLWIASFDEVAQSILQICGQCELSCISTVDVLNWVMENTKAESVRGLLEWAGNGIHFRKTQLARDNELVDENWELETLYEEKIRVDKIFQVIQSKALVDFKDLADEVVKQICRQGFVYGREDEVCVTSRTDECERELQIEEEVQQEREVEVTKCSPKRETPWEYRTILYVKSVKDLKGVVEVLDMTSFIREWISLKEMADLAWNNSHVYGTRNFFTTVEAQTGVDRLDEFVRRIDVVLVFETGDVLLVSECEADHILELLWSIDEEICSFSFVNVSLACESLDRVGISTKLQDVHLAIGPRLDRALPLLSTIACQVYNGETMQAKHREKDVESTFRELLRPLIQREATLSNFVKSRGNSHKWTRSFLHELCCRMDLETC